LQRGAVAEMQMAVIGTGKAEHIGVHGHVQQVGKAMRPLNYKPDAP
jgi:hypothetical protein